MQLIYRGSGYNYTPATVESQPTAIAGQYRGAAYRFHKAVTAASKPQPALQLIYRGAH